MAGYIGKAQGKILANVETNAVESGDIQDSAVTSAKIADSAVTDAKLNSTKLDGIETGATADQTGAEIKTAYESQSNTNAYTDAEKTKLSGIEANADVTDTANVTSAGALMDSEVTNLDQVKAFDSSDYATAAQGTKADSAVQNLSDLSITATATEINKLDGVTATTTELNYVDGVTSNVQTQLNAKQATLTAGTDYQTPLVAGTDYLTPTGDGSNLTGITAYTKSSSDPTITTNPDGGDGSIWVNYSNKKIYICYDATTNANKWQNVHDSNDIIQPNTAPTNPTNTGSFPSSAVNGESFTFTFSGSTDTTGSVTHYLVDNFSSNSISVSSAEVNAGSAHSFTVANISVDENFSFRVRAKDQYGLYSSGATISISLVAALFMAASGGSVVTSGDYKIHTFTSSGTFTVTDGGNSAGSNSVEFLVVAGGGGGGQDRGGGGGAGGYRRAGGGEASGGGASAESQYVVSPGNYTVTIGGGGSGAPNESTAAGYGSNSVFGSITSIGGGRGGNGATGNNGGNGGSGGGAKSGTGGSGTTGQGYAGASGGTGLGGGGAGGVGTSSGDPRSGGPGVASSITGSSVTRAAGGRGSNNATNNDPAGATNSGNGGPGGGYPGYQQAGKAGGSGIVVVKYKFQ